MHWCPRLEVQYDARFRSVFGDTCSQCQTMERLIMAYGLSTTVLMSSCCQTTISSLIYGWSHELSRWVTISLSLNLYWVYVTLLCSYHSVQITLILYHIHHLIKTITLNIYYFIFTIIATIDRKLLCETYCLFQPLLCFLYFGIFLFCRHETPDHISLQLKSLILS